jgi:hypothetical protein
MNLIVLGVAVLSGGYTGELGGFRGDVSRGSRNASTPTLTRSHDEASTARSAAGEGKVYYVAPTGSDANPGTQTQPFRTIGHGASVLTPGATLYVNEGTYAEALIHSIPSGASWAKPVTIAAIPRHRVTLRPHAGSESVLRFKGSQSYIVVEGFILDAINVTYDAVKITYGSPGDPAAHHIRLKDCEVKNAPKQGILVTAGSNANEFIDLDVHDNGTTDFHHGFYIGADHNLVDGSSIHRNAGWGVHVYSGSTSPSHNVIRNNAIFDNARVGERGPGIILSTGSDNIAYNNLIWGNTIGIQVNYDVVNAKIYNNTVYSNRYAGITVGPGSEGAVIQNNIIYQNLGPSIINDGSGTLQEHNLIDIDPRFVDAAAADFRLRADSPAIDVGMTISLVTTDFADTPRPQGGRYDIGAFEY